jgi:beta-N-acetylhexosaminidase
MALGATRSPNTAFDIAKATATELAAVGINWNFAPVLDVISEQGNTTVSVRAFGDDPQMVGRFGVAFMEGLRAGGVGHCVKHFPGIASRDGRRDSVFQAKTADEIEATEMVPFRRAVAAGLDSIMLSSSIWPSSGEEGDAIRAKHIIGEVLRRQIGYDGVTVCDVTDMPLFTQDPSQKNIGEAVVTAVSAGCDMILMYHSPSVQQAGLQALYSAISAKRIYMEQIYRASSLIFRLKDHYFSWRTALANPDPQRLPSLMQQHQIIARKAYENAITVVRDERSLIPLSNKITPSDEVLLLTPVVRPLHPRAPGDPTIDPFESLGRALSRRHPRIVHAPYTAQGITQTHVALIKRAAAIIFVTANASRPGGKSQVQTAGAVHRLCYSKPMVNLAAGDPFDLLDDRKYATYVCAYEYSPMALEAAAAVVFGERPPQGVLPVQEPGAPSLRHHEY